MQPIYTCINKATLHHPKEKTKMHEMLRNQQIWKTKMRWVQVATNLAALPTHLHPTDLSNWLEVEH